MSQDNQMYAARLLLLVSTTRKLLPWSALVLLTAGCATGGSGTVNQRLSAEQNIQRLADREAKAPPGPLVSVPVPPGVGEAVLAPRPADDVSSRLSVDEAVRHIALSVTEADAAEPVQAPPVDDATRDQALWHYAKGRDAAMRNRHLVAITELEKAHRLDPQSALIIRQLARSYAEMGNATRATAYYEQLLAFDPDDSESLFVLGLAATNRREFRRAADFLARPRLRGTALDHDPAADCLTDFMLGSALGELGYDRAWIELATSAIAKLGRLTAPTAYRFRYESLYRQRAEIWRSVGDARCRLREYDQALAAYRLSKGLPNADPRELHPRVIYANLAQGRPWTAQLALLNAIDDDRGAGEQDIRMCLYVSQQLDNLDLLADALVEKHRARPDDATLVRAAATLLPRDEAVMLLRGFLHRRPDDLDVLGQLLGWLAIRDERSALSLTVALVEDHPDLGAAYADELALIAVSPQAMIDEARTLVPSPARTVALCRLLVYVGALGSAWTECLAGVETWPHDQALLLQQIDLAARLEEPQLLDRVLETASMFDDGSMWRARARAHRALGDTEAAVHAAARAVEAEPSNVRALVELAAAHVTHAQQLRDLDGRRRHAEDAARAAHEAIELDPRLDDAYAILLGLYAPNALLANGAQLLSIRGRLARDNPTGALATQLAAREDVAQGRWEGALETLLVVCENDPADRSTLALAMAIWTQTGRLDDAAEYLQRRLGQRPADPALLEHWAAVAVQTEQTDEVAQRLTVLLSTEPSHDTARQLLEIIERSEGRVAEAVVLAETRLLSRPRGIRRELELAALYAGAERDTLAVAQLEWILQRADTARFDQLVTALAVAGRMTDRDEQFNPLTLSFGEQTVTRFPDAPLQVYGSAMLALARAGPVDERFDDMADRAVRFGQGAAGQTLRDVDIWRQLAQALVDAGYSEAAGRAVRRRLLADVPLDPSARTLLGVIALVSDAATGDAVAAVDLIEALALRGWLPRFAGRDQEPRVAEVFYWASNIFALLGHERGAERLLVETIELQPDHAMALNNLGYTRLERGRIDPETIAMIEKAHTLDPPDSNILDTVGWMRYKMGLFDAHGDIPGAVGLIRRSIENSPEPSAEVLDHLGDTLWRLGDAEGAADVWRRVTSILQDETRRENINRDSLLLQARGWGLVVAQPDEIYDRQFGALLKRAREKLRVADDGGEPAVAETFEEMGVSVSTPEVGDGGP